MVSDANEIGDGIMGRKLVAEVLDMTNGMGAALARIQWDAEWEEFRVSVRGMTYHTTSRADAVGTAFMMVRNGENVPTNLGLVCRKSFGGCGEA